MSNITTRSVTEVYIKLDEKEREILRKFIREADVYIDLPDLVAELLAHLS